MSDILPTHPIAQHILSLLGYAHHWFKATATDSCIRHKSGFSVLCDLEASEGPARMSIVLADGSHFTMALPRKNWFSYKADRNDPFVRAFLGVSERCDVITRGKAIKMVE